jgi:PUB domain
MSAQPPSGSETGVSQRSTAVLSNAADALVLEFHRQRDGNACRACCVTILKLIDNVLRHNDSNRDGEMYSKVRRINLSNKVIQQSILSYKGGWEFLSALGFTRTMQTTIGDPNALILLTENEDVSHFIKGRQLLQSICIYELHLSINELPPPPSVIATSLESVPRNTSTTSGLEFPGGFNPYQGQRVDIGVPKGQHRYPSDYQSPTEMELQRLASAQAKLEQQVQVPLSANREWALVTGNVSSSNAATVSSSSEPPRTSDGALLAARAQKLHAERQARDTAGFTTKAMREVEQMKRARVYSHVQLCVHVPVVHRGETTTTILQFSGKFLPRETIGQVMDALLHDCFRSSSITRKDFELYITPPKRVLSNYEQTLLQEGLVPAAKVFCRWTTFQSVPSTSESIQSQWVNELNSAASVHSNANLAFPTSVPVLSATPQTNATDDMNDATDDAKKKKPPLSKEEALLQRMMGGTSRNPPKKKKDDDGPPANSETSGSNKPKWFKR